ncbi:hypothetical protein Pla123a_06030 [Posidoniimonas polymericola]|uniref:PEP-CTERM protein-sorting domain-containing protein n=1 Tax=Posidoniimonas polymericola TaxID=2528002 RepID=A0A5C5ZF38_9BACT|nr:hypothetical protein [Posidoniimonas polymericola]TWT85796.1 hypothetical protein Pla123a_06030 [Posidoniimonas polymericola]
MTLVRLIGLAAVCTHATLAAAQVTSFDDVEYWVGEGANRAALVIDWSEFEGEGDPLVWGYRWDGVATGRQMLIDVITADERLYGKLTPGDVLVLGLGYDRHEPASFAISDGSTFDQSGLTHAGTNNDFNAAATDPGDAYAEGWDDDFWHYATRADGFDSPWVSSQQPMGLRTLTDGVVDGWTFTQFVKDQRDYVTYPDPASPALPPAVPLLGDYNADGSVDAADYTVWRDGGSPAGPIHSDYLLWRDNYLPATGSPAGAPSSASPAPEPLAALLLMLAGVCTAGARLFSSRQLGTTS